MDYVENPIELRGNLKAIGIIGNQNVKIYCMLSDGDLALKDNKTTFGTRAIKVKRGDIICVATDQKTGFEEFCSLDENGKINPKKQLRTPIPEHYPQWVNRWCKSNQNLISKIKSGNLKTSDEVLDIKHIKMSDELKEKFGVDSEKNGK